MNRAPLRAKRVPNNANSTEASSHGSHQCLEGRLLYLRYPREGALLFGLYGEIGIVRTHRIGQPSRPQTPDAQPDERTFQPCSPTNVKRPAVALTTFVSYLPTTTSYFARGSRRSSSSNAASPSWAKPATASRFSGSVSSTM